MPLALQVGYRVCRRIGMAALQLTLMAVGLMMVMSLFLVLVMGLPPLARGDVTLATGFGSVVDFVQFIVWAFTMTSLIFGGVLLPYVIMNAAGIVLWYHHSNAPLINQRGRLLFGLSNVLGFPLLIAIFAHLFWGNGFGWFLVMIFPSAIAAMFVDEAFDETNNWLADTLDYKPKRKVKAS